MPHTKSPEGDRRAIRIGESQRDELKTEYWESVTRVLREVFEEDVALANDLRERVDNATEDAQSVFYEANPFAVAADLARGRYLRR